MVIPDFDDRAHVLFGGDMRREFGDGDLVSIDRGASQGVVAGTRFALYRDPRNGLPLSELGEAVVVEVGETASRAVLVKVSDVVSAGDVAVRRPQPDALSSGRRAPPTWRPSPARRCRWRRTRRAARASEMSVTFGDLDSTAWWNRR
ncbi:MAG: hypothetical protein R2712_31170 [Vicinamibacterales bacterium]